MHFLGFSQSFLSVGFVVGCCFAIVVFREELDMQRSPRVRVPERFRGTLQLF